MSEPLVTVQCDDVTEWATALKARIKSGEWDPEKWPRDMRQLHRKICAATFLAHQMTSVGESVESDSSTTVNPDGTSIS